MPTSLWRWLQGECYCIGKCSLLSHHLKLSVLGRDIGGIIFMVLWTSLVMFVLFSFLKSCWRHSSSSHPADRPSGPRPSPRSGRFPGDYRHEGYPSDPPPPYSKTSSPFGASSAEGWRPGFWTGAALGGLGTYLMGANRQDAPRQHTYDWERPRGYATASTPDTSYGTHRHAYHRDERGEGSSSGTTRSSLGSMRRSTGFGGSSVR